MKNTRTLFAILMLAFAFAWVTSPEANAQTCNFASNVIPCPGLILGQENVSGTFGTFTGGEEWSSIGKAPVAAPGGDFPYEMRMQRDLTTAVFNLKKRGNATSPIDVNINFGNSTTTSGKTPIAARLDFNYVFQNETVSPATVTLTDVMTLTSATSKQVSPGGPSLICPIIFPGPGAPCFGRVGIENVAPSYTLDVNGIGRFSAIIVTSDARFKQDVKTIDNSMEVLRKLRGTTYNLANDEGLEGFDFDGGRKPGFLAQEVEEILPDLVYTDDNGYKGVDYIGVIPYLVEAVKNLDTENAALRAEMEDLRMQLDATGASKGAGSLGEMRGAELFQNVPNPFNEETRINYYLPESVQKATMIVFDMSGRQIRSIAISDKGQGSVTIAASELEAGMYIYTLLADDREVASKRMIITK